MSGRRVSRLPSLKAPSPNVQNQQALSPQPPPSAGTDDGKEPSRLFKRQTRSRRTSISSSDNGSLGRDAQMSDFAFVEQLEDFRKQLLDLRRDKKKLEDEIIKYKLLCKEKHQTINDLNNKLDAEKANAYDLKEQLTRDLALQMNNLHASEKKKLNFDISILKNDKRKLESEIRLLETTNKGLFEEIRQIRGSYDSKMEKLMKDFHIEIYKESGEKRKLEKKLQESHDKLTKEEYLAKQMELEKERAETEALNMKNKRVGGVPDYGSLDKQNKKIAELEQQLRKIESVKTITENQNIELQKRLKEQEKQIKSNSLQRKPKPENKEPDSPGSERKRGAGLSKTSCKEKVENAEKKIGNKDGKASKKDLEAFLKVANKEKNVLERKIALMEKARQQTGDEKMDNEIAALRQQHRELLDSIAAKEKLLAEYDEQIEEKKRKMQPPTTGLKPPGKGTGIPKSPGGRRRMSMSPSPGLMNLKEDSSEAKIAAPPPPPKAETFEKEQQTAAVEQKDEGVQVELYDDDEEFGFGDEYNEQFATIEGMNMGGGGFMFQEPVAAPTAPTDPLLATHSKDSVVSELEEKINQLEDLRSKDMEKITVLSTQLDKCKHEISALNRKAGAYFSELEDNQTKLNTSFQNIEKLNTEIKNLENLNSSLREEQSFVSDDGDLEKELKSAKDEIETMTKDLREKQLTVMKLHQELHEASETAIDKGSMVRQLEMVVENLRHDNELMREEQMNAETTNEEVLDKLRNYQMRCNQMEELVRSLENDIETNKRDFAKTREENEKLQADKERLEVEADEQNAKISARELELEAMLSENPTSEGSQKSLDLLQEIRHKDNSLKKMQRKHEDTIKTLKKEVEKQVGNLQTKVSKRDDDIASNKSHYNQEKSELLKQITDLQQEIEEVRENLSEKEQELGEVYDTIQHDTNKTNNLPENTMELKEMNKRLAELANENMTLRDQLTDYFKIMKEKRPAGFMGELGKRIQTQRPSFGGKEAPKLTLTDSDVSSNTYDEVEEEEDIGEISVALVLYSYDPATMSPNDYPEDELSLTSGDFIYIFGDPDVDGFYTAELMDGQRGLVPSNFIQIVELNEKKTQQMRRMSLAMAQNAPAISTAMPANAKNKEIPVPCKFRYESIGSKTIECTWELPDTGAIIPILGFKISINKQEFKSTNTGECRTVLNDLPPGRPLYISVATLSPMGEGDESEPCIFGREAMKAPQSLDVTNVSTNSAVVTFVGQPHYFHSVFVDGLHKANLKPGVHVYHLKGLSGDTEYEIRIITLQENETPDGSTSQKLFSCSQSTTFLTEIEGPPLSTSPLSSPLPSPSNIQLSILDKEQLSLWWSAVPCAASYHIYVNDQLHAQHLTDNTQIILLNTLSQLDDQQNFHVVAVGHDEHHSDPSETISFNKSELLSHLSDYYGDNRFLESPDGDNENNHDSNNILNNKNLDKHSHKGNTKYVNATNKGNINATLTNHKNDISLLDYFEKEESSLLNLQPMIIARVLSPYRLNDSHSLNLNQLICVERESSQPIRAQDTGQVIDVDQSESEGYVICLEDMRYDIPPHLLAPVPTLKKVVALYEYLPQQMSPNPDCYNELSFKTGDVILIFEEERDGLFYKGILDNVVGLVPSNFVIDLEAVLHYAHTGQREDPHEHCNS